MDSVTYSMINIYRIKEIDFMGYVLQKENISYHHLVKAEHGGARSLDNGAILNSLTSHPYLHSIEIYDFEIYWRLTVELKRENMLGRIDLETLKKIRGLLNYYEREHEGEKSRKGKILIKEEFVKGRINL